MGEVYRARDSRLQRDVAIKVLPASFSQDADRLRRFEQEARAAGVLNHPNITAVYDIGTHDGAPYVVSELLEGETLRERLAGGALPPRKAIDYALQIAHGLAAAHEKGIVHRDLKPENLFVTRDGRIKILDFGLAKLIHPEERGRETELPTATAGTEPGVVLGTLRYMSPEQVRGQPADVRSDIFSFGAIFYEMLAGQRAFSGASAADTMSAILMKEPPELSVTNKNVGPGLERIVRHCLEKNPEERFHSAHDVAFDLETLSGVTAAGAALTLAPSVGRPRRWLIPAVLLGLVVAAAIGLFLGKRLGDTTPPSFHQLTFRRGWIQSARFASDGQTILYSASWEGKPEEIFVGRPESPESRPFGLAGAEVLAISAAGETAVSLGRHLVGAFTRSGTLARMSVAGGGAPREVLEDVHLADWAPDGSNLAVVREVGGRDRLEFPIGKVLYESAGWIGEPRVSPKADRIAFLDHPARGDDGGNVAVVDLSGVKRTLTRSFASAQGLAWSPGGEIWFTAAVAGSNRALYAVALSGRQRLLARVTAPLTLQDVSPGGRILVSQDHTRIGALVRLAGEEKERDLSWLDWSVAADFSADQGRLLLGESGEGGGAGYSVYLRKTDGSPAVRLGEGAAGKLSPDGRWALSVILGASDAQLVLLPTGAGEAKKLPRAGLSLQRPDWLPDGNRVFFTGNEPGHGPRIYLQDVVGGKPRALTPEGYRCFPKGASPDGKFVAARGPDQKIYLYPLEGGEPIPLPALTGLDIPIQWTSDSRSLYFYRRGELPARIYRLDIASGKKELWRELMPSDSAGVIDIASVCPSPDGGSYAYSYARILSDLFLVEGVK
jgi:hypothetical protein